jgi:hypothetical protein
MTKIEQTIQHIVDLQYRMCQVENNLQYIKVVQALKIALEKFYDLLENDTKLQRQYQSTYICYFYTGCGHSLYDRVCNSLIEYKNGKRGTITCKKDSATYDRLIICCNLL